MEKFKIEKNLYLKDLNDFYNGLPHGSKLTLNYQLYNIITNPNNELEIQMGYSFMNLINDLIELFFSGKEPYIQEDIDNSFIINIFSKILNLLKDKDFNNVEEEIQIYLKDDKSIATFIYEFLTILTYRNSEFVSSLSKKCNYNLDNINERTTLINNLNNLKIINIIPDLNYNNTEDIQRFINITNYFHKIYLENQSKTTLTKKLT